MIRKVATYNFIVRPHMPFFQRLSWTIIHPTDVKQPGHDHTKEKSTDSYTLHGWIFPSLHLLPLLLLSSLRAVVSCLGARPHLPLNRHLSPGFRPFCESRNTGGSRAFARLLLFLFFWGRGKRPRFPLMASFVLKCAIRTLSLIYFFVLLFIFSPSPHRRPQKLAAATATWHSFGPRRWRRGPWPMKLGPRRRG